MTASSKGVAARLALWLAFVFLPLASGCAVYRIDIQQGNVVTQEMISKLRPDMTRQQVKYVMGTPLVADTFHPDRWDYFYKFDKAGNPRDRRQLTLVFDGDKLKKILGDVTAAPGLVDSAGTTEAPGTANKPLPKDH